MPDPTDAEIQAGADAIARSWRVLSPTSRRHLAKLVLRAVLPDHDARVMEGRLAELARQRDAAAAERDRIRGEMESCVWIDPRRQSGTPCLGGTRISAYIIARLVADGTTAEQIRDMYPDVTDGHLRAVAAFMADRDTARRDGAADALAYAAQWIRKVFTGIDPEIGRVLDAMEYSVRAGVRAIPTTEGDHHD